MSQSVLFVSGIVLLVVVIVVGGIVYLIASDSFYEASEKRKMAKSVVVRERVSKQVDDVESRAKELGILDSETDEGEKLRYTIKECRYLARDGRRSLNRIEKLSGEIEFQLDRLKEVEKV